MAYKNKKRNKAHIADLRKTGWRLGNTRSRKLREFYKTVRHLDNRTQVELARMRGLCE